MYITTKEKFFQKAIINFYSILFCLTLVLFPITVLADPVETSLVKIPIVIENTTYQLDAKVYKPAGNGPFTLIVLTHGTSRTTDDNSKDNVDTYFKNQSTYFASNGYAVLFVLRRGFGTSTAPYAESALLSDEKMPRTRFEKRNFIKDEKRDYTHAGLEAAKDLSTAITFAKSLPYIDSKRIILMGQSTGGHSVIATGSLNIDGVIGIVNFAGGRGSYEPDRVSDEESLIASMGYYGKTSHVPTLWLYALNDHYFRPVLAHSMFKSYTDNGGQATFIDLPAFGDDGHKSFTGNRKVWAPYVNEFLQNLNPAQ
jgi:dienelactone hydrolase